MLLVLLATLVGAVEGHAADPKDQARPVFQQGVEAFEKGRFDQALELLTKAEGIYHAPPHLLFIARTQAAKKQLLAARDTYKKLDAERLPPKAPPGFVTAQSVGREELAELEKIIPKIRVRLAPPPEGQTTVTLDGTALSQESVGASIDVDPGSHTVVVENTGYRKFEQTVEARERGTAEVEVVLKKRSAITGPVTPPEEEAPSEGGGPSGLRIASFVTMGVGVAGLGVGATMGILSLTKQGESDDIYDSCGGAACTQEQRDEITDLDATAATFGNVGVISLIAGGAVLGAGIVMFALSGDDGGATSTTTETGARLFLGPTSARVDVTF